MGWAGLSPKGCWADLGSTILSASFGLGRTQPRHQGWARTSPTQKIKRGELFPPSHPPACRSIFVLHAGGNETENKGKVGGERRVTWHGEGGALLVWLRT
jgi:hypothetical protein